MRPKVPPSYSFFGQYKQNLYGYSETGVRNSISKYIFSGVQYFYIHQSFDLNWHEVSLSNYDVYQFQLVLLEGVLRPKNNKVGQKSLKHIFVIVTSEDLCSKTSRSSRASRK